MNGLRREFNNFSAETVHLQRSNADAITCLTEDVASLGDYLPVQIDAAIATLSQSDVTY